MLKQANNYAFIDSQNLNLGVQKLGWKLNFSRFRVYLAEKYGVKKAYMFIGFVAGNNELYDALPSAGYVCIFKPTLKYKDGTTKGNCDAELVLHTMIEYPRYDKAIIVTGDGDFYCLVKYLIEHNKLEAVVIPNRFKFSALLKFKMFRKFLRYLNDLRARLEYKKRKGPIRTEP